MMFSPPAMVYFHRQCSWVHFHAYEEASLDATWKTDSDSHNSVDDAASVRSAAAEIPVGIYLVLIARMQALIHVSFSGYDESPIFS